MLYYELINGKINTYCNNERLAQLKMRNGEWQNYHSTDEEIVMQSDGSGLVLKSDYIEPPIDNTYYPTIEERVEANEEAIISLMEMLSE